MLAILRVGAVSYLNAKPLYYRLTEFSPRVRLEMDLPSRLADRLAAGSLDLALIPSVEYLRGAALGYEILPGFAIAARGAVRSVKLFSRVPFGRIERLALDAGSRTSQALTLVWLDAVHGARLEARRHGRKRSRAILRGSACGRAPQDDAPSLPGSIAEAMLAPTK